VVEVIMYGYSLGVATVVEALSRAYLADGRLTTTEINEAFSLVDKRKSAE